MSSALLLSNIGWRQKDAGFVDDNKKNLSQ